MVRNPTPWLCDVSSANGGPLPTSASPVDTPKLERCYDITTITSQFMCLVDAIMEIRLLLIGHRTTSKFRTIHVYSLDVVLSRNSDVALR